jgi:hypothetical protein
LKGDNACPPPARNASILHELALPFCSYEHNEKMHMASFNARQAGRSRTKEAVSTAQGVCSGKAGGGM